MTTPATSPICPSVLCSVGVPTRAQSRSPCPITSKTRDVESAGEDTHATSDFNRFPLVHAGGAAPGALSIGQLEYVEGSHTQRASDCKPTTLSIPQSKLKR